MHVKPKMSASHRISPHYAVPLTVIVVVIVSSTDMSLKPCVYCSCLFGHLPSQTLRSVFTSI